MGKKMKLKIGIEADGALGWRGPGRNIRNLINHITQSDTDNEYYIFSFNDMRNHINQRENTRFIRLPKLPIIPKSNLLLPLTAIYNKIDCMLFPSGNHWLWPVKRTIIILRTGGPDTQTTNSIDKLHSYVKYKLLPFVADAIVTVSNDNAEKIKRLLNGFNKDIYVVHNGIDPLFSSCKTKCKKNEHEKYLLYVGGYETGKNIENMLTGFKIIYNNVKNIKMHLVGDVRSGRKDIVNVQEIIDRNDLNTAVFALGRVNGNELVDAYKNALLLVFPSLLESFGNAPLEAMACGCPVVASNAPAIPEVCGDAAIYFDPYDPKDIAEKIEMVLYDEKTRTELIAKGYQRVKKYTWDESALKLLKIIEQVANK